MWSLTFEAHQPQGFDVFMLCCSLSHFRRGYSVTVAFLSAPTCLYSFSADLSRQQGIFHTQNCGSEDDFFIIGIIKSKHWTFMHWNPSRWAVPEIISQKNLATITGISFIYLFWCLVWTLTEAPDLNESTKTIKGGLNWRTTCIYI